MEHMEHMKQQNPKIISCNIMGGLGNQLFQIFTTIAYGMKNKRNIIFPYSKELPNTTTRYTFWDSFLDKINYMTTLNSAYTNEILSTFFLYRENGFHFRGIPENLPEKTKLFGYFQSHIYFRDYYDSIRLLIQMDEKQDKIYKEYKNMYFSDNDNNTQIISIHFRIGDYKKYIDTHPIIPYHYYEKALSFMLSENKDKTLNTKYKVLYFCENEDNDFVKREYIDKLERVFNTIKMYKVDDNIEDWKQMLLMSCCHHHIIANSSFSWWGAYFNGKENKIVCYPSIWFGKNVHHDTKDLFPEEWNRISV